MSWGSNTSSWSAGLWTNGITSEANNNETFASSFSTDTHATLPASASIWGTGFDLTSTNQQEQITDTGSPSFFSNNGTSPVIPHKLPPKENETNYQTYSPLLGPAPFHSTFEKLFLSENDKTSSAVEHEEQLDVVSPLFECEDYRGEPVEEISLPKTKKEQQKSSQNSRVKKQSTASPKSSRKRTKSKKGKVVLSLQDFHSLEAESVEELEPNASPVLWVGNIGPLVTEDQVNAEFSVFGNILNLHILRDKFCAFVTYDCAQSAAKAKKHLDREIIGDQYVVIHYRQPNGTLDNAVTNPPSNSLWIGNISEGLTEAELLCEFERFGAVESIRLLPNCAFVNYFTVDDAARALHYLQGKQLGQLSLRINFGKTRPTYDTIPGEGYDYMQAHSYEGPSLTPTHSPHVESYPMSSTWSGPSPIPNHHEYNPSWEPQTQYPTENYSGPVTIGSLLSAGPRT